MEVTGDPLTHQALLVELPIFIATAAEPIATVVMPVVSEPNRVGSRKRSKPVQRLLLPDRPY
jgi:hypothetical protein